MTFEDCCKYCLNNKTLVEQFNRLTGLRLGAERSKIEKIIDASCGYEPDNEAIPAFVSFVFQYVWVPMTNSEVKS